MWPGAARSRVRPDVRTIRNPVRHAGLDSGSQGPARIGPPGLEWRSWRRGLGQLKPAGSLPQLRQPTTPARSVLARLQALRLVVDVVLFQMVEHKVGIGCFRRVTRARRRARTPCRRPGDSHRPSGRRRGAPTRRAAVCRGPATPEEAGAGVRADTGGQPPATRRHGRGGPEALPPAPARAAPAHLPRGPHTGHPDPYRPSGPEHGKCQLRTAGPLGRDEGVHQGDAADCPD